jgi:hypothetical protein
MSLGDRSYVHDEDLIMQEHRTVYNGFLIALEPDLYDPILRLQKEVPWMLGGMTSLYSPPAAVDLGKPDQVLVASEGYCYQSSCEQIEGA